MQPLAWRPRFTLRTGNHVLTGLVALLALYIILSPLLPLVGWWLHPPKGTAAAPVSAQHAPIPTEPTLKIPRLAMQEIIHTGPTQAELSKGVWLLPKTSTPDKHSNTVMAGHRFTYGGPAVFYFLDKVQLHDQIIVDWQHKEYTYRVDQIRVVPPTEISVQAPTAKPTLTVYTCTPLVTDKNRLVLIASLIKERT